MNLLPAMAVGQLEARAVPTPVPFEARPATPAHVQSSRWELAAFALLIALLNWPLLVGHSGPVFLPQAVQAGQWWRLFTHPFVHVSGYHLAFDATAFLLVYAELGGLRRLERLVFVATAAAGSLLVTLFAEPSVWEHGLCGLSGIAHGLTALAGLELFRKQEDRMLRYGGLVCFAGVVVKVILEAAIGHVMLASWHMGDIGTPMTSSHAGGVVGVLAGVLGFSRAFAPTSSQGRFGSPWFMTRFFSRDHGSDHGRKDHRS